VPKRPFVGLSLVEGGEERGVSTGEYQRWMDNSLYDPLKRVGYIKLEPARSGPFLRNPLCSPGVSVSAWCLLPRPRHPILRLRETALLFDLFFPWSVRSHQALLSVLPLSRFPPPPPFSLAANTARSFLRSLDAFPAVQRCLR